MNFNPIFQDFVVVVLILVCPVGENTLSHSLKNPAHYRIFLCCNTIYKKSNWIHQLTETTDVGIYNTLLHSIIFYYLRGEWGDD